MKNTYILALDFEQDVLYYIRCNDDDSYDECYSPMQATEFMDSESALKWGYNNTTFGEYIKAIPTVEAHTNFQEWFRQGMLRRHFSALDKKISRKYNKDKDDKYAVLEWRYQSKKADDDIRYEDYKTWPHLHELFECLFSWEQYCKENDYSQKEITIQICVNKTTTFKVFEEELKLVLDKITRKDEQGSLIIPIFDHYLSEYGNSANLLSHEDGTWSVYIRHEPLVKKRSLETCFNYIQEYRYYV